MAALITAAAILVACDGSGLGANDAVGKKGVVAFSTETALAFSGRLVVGSSFVVETKAVEAKDDDAVAKGVLSSSNDKVLAIKDGKVNVAGPGTAELRLDGSKGTIDSIDIHAGKAGATTLIDSALLAASSSIDPRLPASFAIRIDVDHTFQVAAVDKCGGDMLDLHASSIDTAGDAPAVVTAPSAATFTVKTQVPGNVALTLKTPGLDDLAYDLKSVDPGSVDEVHVAAVSADDQGNVTLWGRAFANGAEVVGDLPITWSADPRVSLTTTQGLVVAGLVSFPASGDPPDDRPATVTAVAFGETGTLDLLTASATTSRGTPARELPGSDASSNPYGAAGAGCGSNACNPEAALIGVVAIARLRRLRLLRRG